MESKKIKKQVLAFDFGGSSGRVVLGRFDGRNIEMKEIHRFDNSPVIMRKTMYWDVLRLFLEIKNGLVKAKEYGEIDSIGIDTWGVDFALLDKNGDILENPIHYRDNRTVGMIEESFKKIDREDFYKITGNQFMEINTAFQLLSLKENRGYLLERADTMLLIPDLFNYLLTGVKVTEMSIASTTQLFDANKRIWSEEVIRKLGLPRKIFTNIVQSGRKIGEISKEIVEELQISKSNVIAVASHDTQSAMMAVPSEEKDFIFLSCGTWSLLGTELDNPIINEVSSLYNVTNESGYGQSVSFLKNIIGLWLIQESKRQWEKEGIEYSYGELEEMAKETEKFKCFIDPDDPIFVQAGDIPSRIREYCIKTNQCKPETIGEIVRCINESLALKYRIALEEIEECTKKNYSSIYLVGGGAKSKMLCQMTANACGCKVIAGPEEGTVIGNIGTQLLASKDIENIQDLRKIIKESEIIKEYIEEEKEEWNLEFEKYKNIIKKKVKVEC
ncbi:MAG: rhamnulokinase [Clostridium sp.]|uniref:rhamnulokinase n=1 Tax=Clostridium sp. TaxID=1506 RepID=UPI003EE525FB